MCFFSQLYILIQEVILQYIIVTIYVYYVYIACARIHFLEVAVTLNKQVLSRMQDSCTCTTYSLIGNQKGSCEDKC